jgi:hypothetical protein
VLRIQRQAAETAEIGTMTLQELQNQRTTLGRALEGGDRMNDLLDVSEKLQNRFSRWALKFNNRREGRRDAKAELRNEKRRDELKEMRNIHDGMAQKALQSTNEETTIGKHERKSKGMRMPAPEQGADFDHNKGILYGRTMDNDEQNHEMLNKLAAKDAKIDESLDIVRAQLKGILAMYLPMLITSKRLSTIVPDAFHLLTGNAHKKYEKPFKLGIINNVMVLVVSNTVNAVYPKQPFNYYRV